MKNVPQRVTDLRTFFQRVWSLRMLNIVARICNRWNDPFREILPIFRRRAFAYLFEVFSLGMVAMFPQCSSAFFRSDKIETF